MLDPKLPSKGVPSPSTVTTSVFDDGCESEGKFKLICIRALRRHFG